MAAARDLYEVLGVSRDASPDEIRRAYRRLAREHHPDVSADPAGEERFKEVVGAYEILSDPAKRQQYDAFGNAGGPGAGFADVQDIFDLFFGAGGFPGGGQRRRGTRGRARRGDDLGVRLTLSFTEAMFGARRELDIDRLVVCETCGGNGAAPGTAPVACGTCGGVGEVQSVRRSVFGTVMTAAACSTCGGTGTQILDPCETCGGRGRRREPATVAIDVPAGVADGMELRVAGNGHAGVAGGPAGDLFASLSVEPSAEFDRRGQDLHTVLDITMTQAALGADVTVTGADGPERIRVDPGTESGTVLRVKGKGVPNLNRRGRGDLYVTLHVVTARELSNEQRALLEQLAEMRGEERGPTQGRLRRPEF